MPASRRLLLPLLAFAIAAPSAAGAVTVDGKWGIGFEETLTGIGVSSDPESSSYAVPSSGLVIHRFVGHWNLEAVVGGFAHVGSGPTRWGTFISLGGHYAAYRAPRANLSAGLRVILGLDRPVDSKTGNATPMRFGTTIEVPLRAAFFLSDRFMITGAVGPVAALQSSTGNPLPGGRDGVQVNLFKGGFSGGLGFAVLFR